MAAVGYRVISQIAEELGVPDHRVRYAIQTRGIREAGWAGGARLYDEEAVARIGAIMVELNADKRAQRVREAKRAAAESAMLLRL